MYPFLWPFKIIIKTILSRLPIPYSFWQKIGLFRHGQMDQAAHAIKIFNMHTQHFRAQGGTLNGATLLEMGPGDSVASAVIAATHGVKHIYLVDVGAFATTDLAVYQRLAMLLRDQGLNPPDLSNVSDLSALLALCNATYITNGLLGMRAIPENAVDFSWSHSVLEHVRLHQFLNVFTELYRAMQPGGYSSHNIDFQDHLAYALNNLRFPEWLWEKSWMANAGFYTNRIRAVDMFKMFAQAGFNVIAQDYGHWPAMPTPRAAMNRQFQTYDEAELKIRTAFVLLRK